MINEKIEYIRVSLSVPQELLDEFDEFAKNKGFSSRRNAFINIIEMQLKKE